MWGGGNQGEFDGRDPKVAQHHKTLNTEKRVIENPPPDAWEPAYFSLLEDSQAAVDNWLGVVSEGIGFLDVELPVRMPRRYTQQLGTIHIRGSFDPKRPLTLSLG